MLNILARSFMTATRTEERSQWRPREDLPRLSWLEDDLPFRHHATRRSGYDD